MNLRNISDLKLLSQTDSLVQQEREILIQVLHHLREIERRRLFASLKFHSLFDYATKRLGYSSDQAQRRISAMRLLRELPELEPKISSGAVTLTTLGMAKTLFKKKAYSAPEKLSFITKIEKRSTRDVARMVATISPEALLNDSVRPVSETQDELRLCFQMLNKR